jgi:hypothetical protein
VTRVAGGARLVAVVVLSVIVSAGVSAAVSVGVPLPAAIAPAGAQRPSTSAVMSRASAYVTRFISSFTSVVAQEDYVQRLANGQRVATKADFLLVQLGPNKQYIPFRDVYEVNGAQVRDHENRLVDLFTHLSEDILEQARSIHVASSRYNIGAQRTINSPLLGLALLQPELLSQFTFSMDDSEKIDSEMTDVLKFAESGRPTIIRENGGDAPASGEFRIAQTDGAILRSDVHIDTKNQTSTVTVKFHRDERYGLAVPVQMNERYRGRGPLTEAQATYGRFRQFEIKTEEAPKDLPK